MPDNKAICPSCGNVLDPDAPPDRGGLGVYCDVACMNAHIQHNKVTKPPGSDKQTELPIGSRDSHNTDPSIMSDMALFNYTMARMCLPYRAKRMDDVDGLAHSVHLEQGTILFDKEGKFLDSI